ncbi:MAG: transglutaminase domain-containing protein [Planctomycetaceae bacterium]|nr:transglutaminase domain-containing protein [Planctomycetaceae bacterium]
MKCLAVILWLVAGWLSPGTGVPRDDTPPAAVRLTNPHTERWQFGVVVRARGDTTGIVATLPVPMPWPEQDVKVLAEEVTPHVRNVRYRVLDNGVKQMMVSIPRLSAGEEAAARLTVEIVKRDIVAPQSTEVLRVPASVPRALRIYLGTSPYIDSDDRVIRQAAEQVVADQELAWHKVEAVYDWVRAKVAYRFDRQIKGARQALDDGFGDCEELTSLFVAMCRGVGIPARCVWVPGHCYPEFYLEDDQGQGHWYPCQAAGTRIFGAMAETRPILQKGDNFRVTGSRQGVRYVQETLTAKHAAADPDVEFVQKLVE